MLSYKHNNFLGRPLNLFLSLLQSISGGLLDIYGPKLFVDNRDVRHTNRTLYGVYKKSITKTFYEIVCFGTDFKRGRIDLESHKLTPPHHSKAAPPPFIDASPTPPPLLLSSLLLLLFRPRNCLS